MSFVCENAQKSRLGLYCIYIVGLLSLGDFGMFSTKGNYNLSTNLSSAEEISSGGC